MIIGSHVQMKAPKYLEGAVGEAISYDANALMLYTGAPQNTRRVATEVMHIEEAHRMMKVHGIACENMIIHAPYIINPANSVKEEVGQLAVDFLSSESFRAKAIGACYRVLHPGSYTTTDLHTGIATAIRHLNETELADGITICLETMAGKGSEIGYRFEQLAEILEGLDHPEKFGICMDTCHISDAGYDLSDFDSVLHEFDHYIGRDRLHVIHLNDSKNPRGARKDRHANIGQGTIGLDILASIASRDDMSHIPMILETPYVDGMPPYRKEIELIRNHGK